MTPLQNLEINYKVRMGSFEFRLLDSERGELKLNIRTMSAVYKIQDVRVKCQLLSR